MADGTFLLLVFLLLSIDGDVAAFLGQAPAPARAAQVHRPKAEIPHLQHLEVNGVQLGVDLVELLPIQPSHHEADHLQNRSIKPTTVMPTLPEGLLLQGMMSSELPNLAMRQQKIQQNLLAKQQAHR